MQESRLLIVRWTCADITMLGWKIFPLGDDDGNDANNGQYKFWAFEQLLTLLDRPLESLYGELNVRPQISFPCNYMCIPKCLKF